MVCVTKEHDFLLKGTDSVSAWRSWRYAVLASRIQVSLHVACIYFGRQKAE